MSSPTTGTGNIDFNKLQEKIGSNADAVQAAIDKMQSQSSTSIGDMFAMQMKMNCLSQSSEMATNVVSASNSAIQSAARNVKG